MPLAVLLLLLLPVFGDLECEIGWGSGTHKIPESKVNDGYCDCPVDGADEPNTDACAGAAAGGWPGVAATAETR